MDGSAHNLRLYHSENHRRTHAKYHYVIWIFTRIKSLEIWALKGKGKSETDPENAYPSREEIGIYTNAKKYIREGQFFIRRLSSFSIDCAEPAFQFRSRGTSG